MGPDQLNQNPRGGLGNRDGGGGRGGGGGGGDGVCFPVYFSPRPLPSALWRPSPCSQCLLLFYWFIRFRVLLFKWTGRQGPWEWGKISEMIMLLGRGRNRSRPNTGTSSSLILWLIALII